MEKIVKDKNGKILDLTKPCTCDKPCNMEVGIFAINCKEVFMKPIKITETK